MKIVMEVMRELRYELRMIGAPVTGPTYTYGDDMSVVQNTQRHELTLKREINSICYHAIRDSVAMGKMVTAHIRTTENVADFGIQVIPGG